MSIFLNEKQQRGYLNGNLIWGRAPLSTIGPWTIEFEGSGTAIISNRWGTGTTYSLNGGAPQALATTATVSVVTGDIIVVENPSGYRTWQNLNDSFVRTVQAKLIKMPAMNELTTDATGTIASSYFFSAFNFKGSPFCRLRMSYVSLRGNRIKKVRTD